MAHEDRSMFAQLDQRLVGPDSVVVQPHGFVADEHADDGEAVVSSGSDHPSAAALRVASSLRAAGLDVCTYLGGASCQDLAATTNVEAQWAASVGAQFVHLEMADTLREDSSRLETVVRLVARALHEVDAP